MGIIDSTRSSINSAFASVGADPEGFGKEEPNTVKIKAPEFTPSLMFFLLGGLIIFIFRDRIIDFVANQIKNWG